MIPAGERAPGATLALIARLLAIDPLLGGIVLRGDPHAFLAAWCAAGGPAARRVPCGIDHERLVGGVDLGATLALGRPVRAPGLLADSAGGLLWLSAASRLDEPGVGAIAGALDGHGPGRFVIAASIDRDATLTPALADRLAFDDVCELEPVTAGACVDAAAAARTLCVAAAACGIVSLRAPMLALRAAQALAVARGAVALHEGDLVHAAALVLAHRATRLPEPESDTPPPRDPAAPSADAPDRAEDRIVAAEAARLPADLLAALSSGRGTRAAAAERGKGERRRSPTHGRPVGARAGLPRSGRRLALIDTLRAAAPWQRLRGRDDARVRIRRDDLRVRRFEARAQATTLFAVDASGSAAMARLAEAKGAVELLLAQAYVKRAEVALIAFRGTEAELLLPPTRSLARARRALAELPGGGGTPIAAGLVAASRLAEAARARGRTPMLVVLSDGRANVALDGGRTGADADARTAASAIKAAALAATFIDISPRPRSEGACLADAMGARYLALPRGDAGAVHRAITGA